MLKQKHIDKTKQDRRNEQKKEIKKKEEILMLLDRAVLLCWAGKDADATREAYICKI